MAKRDSIATCEDMLAVLRAAEVQIGVLAAVPRCKVLEHPSLLMHSARRRLLGKQTAKGIRVQPRHRPEP